MSQATAAFALTIGAPLIAQLCKSTNQQRMIENELPLDRSPVNKPSISTSRRRITITVNLLITSSQAPHPSDPTRSIVLWGHTMFLHCPTSTFVSRRQSAPLMHELDLIYR